jgi:hypothetical protein
MKKYYKVLLLLPLLVGCFPADVFGQWLVRFPSSTRSDRYYSNTKVVEATDKNILVVSTVRDSIENINVTKLCKYNKNNGQIIWQRIFNYPSTQSRFIKLGTYSNDLIQTPNSSDIYLSLSAAFSDSATLFQFQQKKILRLDINGTVLQQYSDTINLAPRSYVSRFVQLDFYDNTLWAKKITSNNDSLFLVRFSSDLQAYRSIVPCSNYFQSEYFFYNSSIYINQWDARIVQYDNQNLVQYNLSGDSISSKLRGSSTIIKQGNIFYGIKPAVYAASFNRDTLKRLDSQFNNFVWLYPYNALVGTSSWVVNAASFLGHTIDKDGGIYVWGDYHSTNGGPFQFPSINKISAVGTLEWQYNYNNQYLNMSRILSLISTVEGVIAVGDNSNNELWIAKLNGWGTLDATRDIEIKEEELKLFPSPAHEIINIEYSEPISAIGNVYSLDGRLIKMFLMENVRDYKLDINDILNGMYYIILRDNSSSKIYKKAFVKL